ncbi:membrane-associated guanylate kinase, WW and PDZ domain-containing protein 2 isoform X1 [Nerophis ophidion]|uniref:membrane-associated guanylate kinase, WW and PDZ domain-containing protein 2 isoform X1 n=1 Tax=Nerophis ophidion TaxID=159077 RepID=UPI002ADF1EB5|nr:membrane-associated guanylate kinase, WW and PDZ domain-containing protein 2 isoform X1 [Nerophis ophidion]XP_061745045.1 membrane-associated guanylate kinase, WW and PDZ domain-containing protein 2 isoform X1 [Nerophis ophidion]XP_061745046.1 membrane-associated guanylate kinase, WW and PDZ domain-containing protein 2 isoform X1 [Nerophis ophidion]
MSKNTVKKLHWRSKVQEGFVPLGGSSGELGLAIGGGADYGEFPFVTVAPGGGATVADIILEIGGTPVLGMTLGDVRGVLNSCPHPIRIKTVSPGASLCKDLRLYLSKCFTPSSMDSQLQQLIRENLYLRAVPCTTRQPREGEISGVDYNFVSIEEFFSLEESGALLESGKFKGNYYGTPRPVHIGPDSPPITYQEHRNLLRNFRTRSKSLSNLEKTVEEDNSEEDSGLSGGSAGAPPTTLPLSQSWETTGATENGGRRGRAPTANTWDVAYGDGGNTFYLDPMSKSSRQDVGGQNQETTSCSELPEFTDEPSQLRGFSVHTRLSKGPRGFGFNIVGGSRAQEFLQVYSVTPGGPPSLNQADILVYINDTCVLGRSHKEVVEMLKSVPMGQNVDVVLRRGYPMLYNPDGCPKHNLDMPQTPPPKQNRRPLTYSHVEDAGSCCSGLPQVPPSYSTQPMTNGLTGPPTPTSFEPPVAPPTPAERMSANHSDSGSSARRSSVIGYNSSTLPTLSSTFLQRQSSKSSESDLSTSTLPITSTSSQALSNFTQPETPPPGGPAPRPMMPQTCLPPTSPREIPSCGFNGCPANHQVPPPAPRGTAYAAGSPPAGELVPVALGRCNGGGLGFSITAGGPGGQLAVVRRVWDRRQCPSLQAGDAVVKINGADVQNLSFSQVQKVLQEHSKKGDMVLLVHRRAPVVTPNLYKPLPSPHGLTSPKSPPSTSTDLPSPSSGALVGGVPPLSQAGLAMEAPQEGHLPAAGAVPTQTSNGPPVSGLIQSTSFLDSVPVTLTLEPRDLQGAEESAAGPVRGAAAAKDARVGRTVEVELRRRPGEGFGFVIASQEINRGAPQASMMSHRFVTVRRGSPAARSGLIQPGDQLDAVEGRAVTGLQHRDLAQILRRAGNALRLSVTARAQTEAADVDIDNHFPKGSRGKSKEESRFYTVDLERGPTGFGFSLRGGSEYNMGLYVLGLMEGGPAERSNKMQVSDQLVEINGNSAVGMTHSQAVEQIRRGGHGIHLVLKKGNGYVPDYGPEDDAPAHTPSREAVTMATTPHSTHRGGGGDRRRRMKTRGSKPRSRRGGPPDLDLDLVEEEAKEEEKKKRMREKRKMREERRSGKMREEEGDAEHCGSSAAPQQAAFSFLMPLDAAQDSQSDDSQSGTGVAQASDWTGAGLMQEEAPGPWLEPGPRKLSQVLTGRRLSGRGLAGGLSL